MCQKVFLGSMVLLLVACGRSPFPGYKAASDDVHLRLRVLGDGERTPSDHDTVLVRIRVAKHDDPPGSLFSTERWYASLASILPEGVPLLREGDSLGVIAKGNVVPWSAMGSATVKGIDTLWVDLEYALIAIGKRMHVPKEEPEPLLELTPEEEEQVLHNYLADTTVSWKEWMGVHYRLDKPYPRETVVRSGETVTIHYRAYSLVDGRSVDDTHKGGQPLTFRLGDPGQVIKGIEIAMHLLPKGGKGRFVIPSSLAFGNDGSSSGIIPPNTPLLYEIEVLNGGVPMDSVAAAVPPVP